MLNRLLYEYYISKKNGEQITSLPDGRRVLLVHSEVAGPATLQLLLARHETPQNIADFDDVETLTGPDGSVPGGGPWGMGGSVIAIGNTVHVAWTGPHGIQYTRATWEGNQFRWKRARHTIEGDYWLGDLFAVGKQLGLTYHQVHDRQNEGVGVGWLDGRWHRNDVQQGRPMFAPVANVDHQERIHLVWSDTAEQLYYTRLDNLGADAKAELLGPGGQPTILVTDEHVLVACVSGYAYGPIRYYIRSQKGWQRPSQRVQNVLRRVLSAKNSQATPCRSFVSPGE